ncbi:hypothetical protein [Candidatus Parabeggiatoa sp. HSG14]|uniref:hypothetical protein n=1 Tax=Candidatus Parabeggiatoa sp. HSG14 TaxID=3055593 RepID=UPI0025A8A8A3|nr:hypothetical protein [Thiotrichales bacterium HSG14]
MTKQVVAFLLDCTDARVIKRMRGFKNNGYQTVGFSFRRKLYNLEYQPEWNNISLGETRPRAYLHRSFMMLKALMKIAHHRKIISKASFLYVINLDQAFLAYYAQWISRTKVPIVYEVADIQSPFVSRGLFGKILRWVERYILNRTHLLVITSPAFFISYFKPIQNYRGNYFLLENKLLPPYVPTRIFRGVTGKFSPKRVGGKQWIVGYFGILQCQKSLEIIKKVADLLPKQVVFYLRGPAISANINIKQVPNIIYGGDYKNPQDLLDIYQQVDFVWCFDFCQEEHNSRWMLPNRLYEGGYFNLPMIAPQDFEIGKYVERYKIGWTFEAPYEDSLTIFFKNITLESYLVVKKNFEKLPLEQFASTKDFSRMCMIAEQRCST